MRILSIDGGGIRGIIPGQILVNFEQKLRQISGDDQIRIADVFDLVAGTSTGGILACIFLCPDKENPSRPRFTAKDAVNLYLENGDDIFDVSIYKTLLSIGGLSDEKYSAEVLEKLLKRYFEDLKLSELLRPCLIPAYDIYSRKACFFNTADIRDNHDGIDFNVRDIARSTSAAPTYFEPTNITASDMSVYPLIDGGVFANNPTMCACIEAFKMDPTLSVNNLKILSLGTGKRAAAYHYSEAKNWGKISWLAPILDIIMSGVSETVDCQLKTLFRSAVCPHQYLRLELDLKQYPDVDEAMDNASEKNMHALKTAALDFVGREDISQQLDAFARMILKV